MDEPLVSDMESANIDDPPLGGGNPYMHEEPAATDEQLPFHAISASLHGDLAFLLYCYCCFLSLFLIAEREEVRDQTEI